MPKLLVIDDEPNIVFSIKECLASDTVDVVAAGSAREGIQLVDTLHPDAVILDVRLPDLSGLDVFERIAQMEPRLPVIIITAYASTETAIEAMRRGAFEYLIKPVDLSRLAAIVDKAFEVSRLSRVPAVLEQDADDVSADRIIGHSPAMQEVYKAIGRIAPEDATVLILGESGTGKELVARAIYHYSRRSQMPFLAINCAAIPESLLESELFGHEQGAFTGADQRRIGKFEQVHHGTLFLDEIGDMSLVTQAKILRLLQEQKFQRIGGTEMVRTDVRILAATNRDLKKRIDQGLFREDLFYRLNVFSIQVPPLRERREDIPLLVSDFIKRFNRGSHKTIRTITDSAQKICQDYSWPGNVRELESAIRFAMVQTSGDVILPDSLPPGVAPVPALPSPKPESVPAPFDLVHYVQQLLREGRGNVYQEVASAVDRIVLREVMESVRGNQIQACKKLGIARMTLRSKLRAIGWLDEGSGSSSETPEERD